MERFVAIHGHFYQPPRENPWTGEIERQPSAGADHDWNARIARECYDPNGSARVLNARGQLVDLVNNYSLMSFDFGPTLLTWYEKEHPEQYRRLIEADRESVRRLAGHGNAIAHAYNHMILPLAGPRDLLTQVRWGLEDFKFRFGREPESLWLPETACSAEVMRRLIDHGLKYVILAPGQAQTIRTIEPTAEEPSDVSGGGIDTRRPYRWFDREPSDKGRRKNPARFIDVFFYDGSVSHAVAFERLMAESGAAADRLEKAFDPSSKNPQLVSAATDGESYGHHQHFAEMGLAHLLKYELPKRAIKPVNYGSYLAQFPPSHEVVLKEGPQGLGTAWSCAHGVARWMEDCGCGSEGGRHQRWRRPLREAMDWLSARLAAHFELEGGRLLKDVWKARDAYIRVLLDGGEASVAAFLREHSRGEDSPRLRADVLRLMEMQKYSMFMYTSCAWFFSEISGLEAVQNLKYAARAIELSGEDLEPEFLSRLERAPSNVPEFVDGRGVYEKLVAPSRTSKEKLAAREALAHEMEGVTAVLEASLEESLSLAEKASGLGVEIPERLRLAAEAALEGRLSRLARGLCRAWSAGGLEEAEGLIARAKLAGIEWVSAEAEAEWEKLFLTRVDAAHGNFTELEALTQFLGKSGLKAWRGSGQIRLFQALRGAVPANARQLAQNLDIGAEEAGRPLETTKA